MLDFMRLGLVWERLTSHHTHTYTFTLHSRYFVLCFHSPLSLFSFSAFTHRSLILLRIFQMEIGGRPQRKRKDKESSSSEEKEKAKQVETPKQRRRKDKESSSNEEKEKAKQVETPKQYFFDLNWTEYMNPKVIKQSEDVCWAIAVAGAVEGRYNLITGEGVEGIVLAPQVLIDGVTMNKKEDHLTSTKKAFSEIKKHGLCKEGRQCKYLGNVKTNQQKQEADKNPNLNRDIFVGDVKGQSPDEDAVDEDTLYECLMSGPVVGFLKACPELTDFKGPGVYCEPAIRDQRTYLHAVIICGAGRDEDENRFWFIKNSYGPKWGDGGYGKVVRLSGPGKSVFVGYSYADVI